MSSESMESPDISNTTITDEETAGEPMVNDQQESLKSDVSQDTESGSESGTTKVTFQPPGSSLCDSLTALSDQLSQMLTGNQMTGVAKLIHSHLPTTVGNPEIPVDGCPLLELIPIECRKQIWECLLYNPLLGESYAGDDYRAAFNLSPAILRVNKQTYNEGMDILYGRNRFLVQCTPYSSTCYRFAICALTRYQELENTSTAAEGNEKIIPAAKYVQHWSIVLSATVQGPPHTGNDLALLCRNIYMASIQSIEVLIIPRGIESGWDSADKYGDETQLALTLKPLERLRNIPRVTIRAAEFDEIPIDVMSDDEELADEFTPIFPNPVDEVRLITLIQGNSDVEIIEEMYKNLLTYAQTFERIEELSWI